MLLDFQVIILILIFSIGLSVIIAIASYLLSDKTPDKE